MKTFADVIRTRVGDQHEGLRFEGRSWTWAEVVREAAVRASVLREVPADADRRQRHVGILLQNVPDFVFWLLAAALNGDAVVGVNPTRRGDELRNDILQTDCDLLVSEPLYLDADDAPDYPLAPHRVYDIESEDYRALLDRHRGAEVPVEVHDAAARYLLLFSSGSTGAPKAVICTQGRLGQLTARMTERVSLHRDSVSYLCLPLFHGQAIMMCLATAVHTGSTIAMVRKFSASRFVSDIRENHVTYVNYVGQVLSYVLATPPGLDDGDNDLEVAFGSEASPADAAAFTKRFGGDIRDGYGASEGVIRIVPVPGAPPDSLGLPVPGLTAVIRNEDGTECPRARFDTGGHLLNAEQATGEMVVLGQGPAFEGYYNNPEAMADRLRFGGEDFWTGDLAYRDEDGYFYFAGRTSDWLRIDGENFATAPVERILARYPAFSGAYAYAVPDPTTGDRLMCAATLRSEGQFDPVRFSDFLDEQPDLGSKWRPTFVRVVEAIPTTANGKVDKAPLRATAWETDNVWWAHSRTSPFHVLTEEQRAVIRAQFAAAGRANVLPAASRLLQQDAG